VAQVARALGQAAGVVVVSVAPVAVLVALVVESVSAVRVWDLESAWALARVVVAA
jgi:hypothetical protein